jgi:hypothetical protein
MQIGGHGLWFVASNRAKTMVVFQASAPSYQTAKIDTCLRQLHRLAVGDWRNAKGMAATISPLPMKRRSTPANRSMVSVKKSAYGRDGAAAVGLLQRDQMHARGLAQCVFQHIT